MAGSTSYEASKLTLLALTAAMLLGHTAWRWRRQRELELHLTWLVFVGAGLLLTAAIGFAAATNRLLVLQGLLLIGLWLCIAVAIGETITTRACLLSLTRALVAGTALAAMYGLLQISRLLPGAPTASGMLPGISSLGNQNYLAGLLGVVFFPSLLLWGGGRGRTLIAVATSGLILITTIVCGALGPLLALLAAGLPLAGGLLLIARGRPQQVARWYLVCLALGIVVAGGGWLLATSAPRWQEGTRLDQPNPVRRLYNRNAGEVRRSDWAIGWEMIKDRPLAGVGLNNYKVVWPDYRGRLVGNSPDIDWVPHGPRSTKAHNEFIQLAAEDGLAGLLLLVVGVPVLLVHLRRQFLRLEDPRRQRDFLLLLAGLNVAALHGLVSFPAHLPATAAALALICGGLASRFLRDGSSGRQCRLRWYPAATVVLGLAALLIAAGAWREFRADLKSRQGRDLCRAGRFDQAHAILTSAVDGRLWPGLGLYYRATSGMVSGDLAAVEQDLRHSLQTEPTYEAYLQLAELLRDRQAFTEAGTLLERLVACRPTHKFLKDAKYVRATIALRRDEHDRARGILDVLLTEAPRYHRAWIALGYLEALAGDLSLAAAHYRQAIAVIDGKLNDLTAAAAPGEAPGGWNPALSGHQARLRQHRHTAVKALASLGH